MDKLDRQKILTEIFENISSLGRSMLSRGPHALPDGMPTRAQMGVMFLISQNSQTIKQIAEKFQITPSAATQLVDNLVEDDLLIRKEDEDDRRKINVELTAKGKDRLKQAKKLRFEKIEKMFEPLSNQELMQLKNIYSKIIDRL